MRRKCWKPEAKEAKSQLEIETETTHLDRWNELWNRLIIYVSNPMPKQMGKFLLARAINLLLATWKFIEVTAVLERKKRSINL